MREYIIGLIVAGVVLGIGYSGLEWLAGRPLLAQEQFVAPDRTTTELIAVLNDADASKADRIAAILDLGKVKKDFDVVVPALVPFAGAKAEYRHAAAIAIGELGEPAVEPLKQYFAKSIQFDDDNQILNLREILIDRSQAAFAIRELGDCCKVYLPQLQEMLQSDSSQFRKIGLFALAGMDSGAEESLDMVIKCLGDSDFNNQCFACRIIQRLGPKAAKAEPKLQELLKTGLPSVQGWAGICLGAIGPSPSKSDNASAMGETLVDASPVVASRLLQGIAALGPDAKHVADKVRDKIGSGDREVKANAAITLWKIDGDERVMLDTLGDMLTSVGYESTAMELIADHVKASAIPLLPKIEQHATAEDPFTRERVALAIAEMGPAAKSALPMLKNLLNDSDPVIRHAAKRAVDAVSNESDTAPAK